MDPAALIELGKAMEDADEPFRDHPSLPAGHTYLGQFIDHDITADKTAGLPQSGFKGPDELVQGRSPSLDLDSVFGLGPVRNPDLYDGVRLKIGETTPTPDANEVFPNDLPRKADRSAIIGDPRNDENLAVAQTHLAFLKFYNKILDEPEVGGDHETARAIATKHYQWLVLFDFTRRVVQPDIFMDVLTQGRKFFEIPAEGHPCMPVEFSVAAYRFGHSLIRSTYQWNRIVNSNGPRNISTLQQLFLFTGGGGMAGLDTLPSNWIIDWTRMHDFRDVVGVENHSLSNAARRIDGSMSDPLMSLPEFSSEQPDLRNLSLRNLLRGRLLKLPTGQELANEIGVAELTPDEVAAGPHAALLRKHGFDRNTPLWYYLLKEGEVRSSGLCLGAVGSRIVTEVFFGLAEATPTNSIFAGGQLDFVPTLPSARQGDFTMADLLAYVGELNPLG
jgi:hypothetical protein